jgi:hypothetical protein
MRILILLILFCSTASAADLNQILTASTRIIREHAQLIRNEAPVSEVVSKGNEFRSVLYEMDQHCSYLEREGEFDRNYKSVYITCLHAKGTLSQTVASTQFDSAKYCETHGDMAQAKDLYRDIITTFTGDAYRSVVKKAEFALEDLKTQEVQLEKKRIEEEKAEQERIEREKAEQKTQRQKQSIQKKGK